MIKLRTDYMIIFLTFVLCVFHTFTYFQVYYSFAVTLGLFVMILLLYCVHTGGIVFIEKNLSLIFLSSMVVVMVVFGTLVKGYNVIYLVGAYFPFVIWAAIYRIVMPLMTSRAKGLFLFFFFCMFAVSVVATLNVVIGDNNAARLLAGAASDELRRTYYKQGVGGYGFVYGSVFLVYGIILFSAKQGSKIYKALLWGVAVLTSVMIIFASYTTALLMLLLSFFLSFYTKSRKRNATFYFVLSVVLLVCLMNTIMAFIYDMAVDLDLQWISNRIGQLIEAETSGSFGELKRSQLYMMSFQSFLSDPLFGGTQIGRHSMFFDTIGMYGLVGLVFFVSIVVWMSTLRKESEGREGLIFFEVMFLYVINTNDTIVLMPMIMFVLPMILSLTKKGSIHEKNTAY